MGSLPSAQKNRRRCVVSISASTTKNTIMNVASKYTDRQSTIIPQTGIQKRETPPPQPVSANVKKNHNLHNLQNLRSPLNPCNLRLGDSVRINSPRESRQKYNGRIGVVCAVVWPRDIRRTIIYVKVCGMQPCFFNSELRFIAPELLEQGVQPCQ